MTNKQSSINNKILGKDAKVLRLVAKPVSLKDIGSKKIGDILSRMKRAMHAEEDGVAIAAPQIGESLRIFVVAGIALELAKKKKITDTDKKPDDLVFINPEIIKASKTKKKMGEGCLSIRYLYGQVSRNEKIAIRAFDEKGERKTIGASGLIAQIFQHEIDHLNGILFTDKAENIQDLPPDPKKNNE